MDLGHLATHGRSTTRTAWATNPLRRALLWLVGPYFRGAGVEIDRYVAVEIRNSIRNFAAEIDARAQDRMRDFAAEIDEKSEGRMCDFAADIEERSQSTVRELAAQIDEKSRAMIASSHNELRADLAYQLTGFRKDAMAVTHRLATLDEEAATLAQAQSILTERIDLLVQARDDISEHVATLQRDVLSAVEGLNERIASLAQREPVPTTAATLTGQGSLRIATSATGTQFLVRSHDLIGRLILNGQEWEPHVRAAIERAAKPDGIAVDAGAYIGVHTITMSRCFRSVQAFEPQRGIYQILCGNLALNSRLNVITRNAALYDRAGSVRLAPQERQEIALPMSDGQPDYDHVENAAALSFDFVGDADGDVPAIALDELALEDAALIKVDTQGADLRVLLGAEGTIRRCRPVVLFEWERDLGLQHGAVLDDYHAFFDRLQYDLAVLQETTPGRQADYIATPRR